MRAAYEPGIPVDRSFLRKTAQLVRAHAETGGIQGPDDVYRLDAETLQRLAEAPRPDAMKVFNLLKALRDVVDQEGARAPYLISIGERAEAIAQAFEDRQTTTQETLRQLVSLVEEYGEAERARQHSDLSPAGFAVYWVLKRSGMANADRVARDAEAALARYPHWPRSPEQERGLRTALYKSLIDAGVNRVVEYGDRLLRILRGAE